MAKVLVCTVFDSKAGFFLNPFVSNTRGEAVRTFGDIMRDSSLPFVKHVSDYQLYIIGEYDNVSGSLVGVTSPDRVIGGDEL